MGRWQGAPPTACTLPRMSRTPREWFTELLGEGRAWSVRHPLEQLRHLAYLARRRRTAGRANALATQVLGAWDGAAFVERFRPFWDPFPTKRAPKYLDIQEFVRDSTERCFALGLFDDGEPKRILDLGCGPGYFLGACRALGHDVVGVDVAEEPLYNELIDFLGIPRIVHAVTPDAPLPALDGSFDLVSAFGVTFNFQGGPGNGSWSADQWARVIDAFVAAAKPGGRVVIHFNQDPRNRQLYPSGLRSRLKRREGIDTRFFGEHLIIDRHAPPAEAPNAAEPGTGT
jgi:SAM-dependent methyltransferase